jgi:hypothetical protein
MSSSKSRLLLALGALVIGLLLVGSAGAENWDANGLANLHRLAGARVRVGQFQHDRLTQVGPT